MSAKVIEAIETELERRGAGVDGDPVRLVRQYWSRDGKLLAEVDTWPGAYVDRDRLLEWLKKWRDQMPTPAADDLALLLHAERPGWREALAKIK